MVTSMTSYYYDVIVWHIMLNTKVYRFTWLQIRVAKLSKFTTIIIYCFTSRSRIFHLYEDATITGEGLQNLSLCSALRTLDLLIDYLLFSVPLKNFSLKWRHHHYWWRAAKLRPMVGAQGLWAGRDIYRATPAVTRDLVFFWSHPKDRPIHSPLTTHKGMWRVYSNPYPHGSCLGKHLLHCIF
jgi:hypothetical protein